MEKVKIGQITAPVGIKGEVRVYPYTDSHARFSDFKKVFVGEEDTVYTIGRFRSDENMVVVKFEEVSDRNTSETLRGKYLYVLKKDYNLEADSYFVDELIGCKVVSDVGNEIGSLVEVIQNTSQDIYRIENSDGKSFLIPAVKEFVIDVDIKKQTITVHLIEGLVY